MFSKLSRLKTLISLNTSHLVMPVEVRILGHRVGNFSSHWQHTYAAFLVLLEQP